MRRFLSILLMFASCCLFAWQPAARAANIDINHAQIESAEDGYRLAANFSFELTRDLESTLTSGIPLYFVTEVEITRPRWYWLDEKTINANQTVRISYNVLTRQYRASVNGNFSQNYKDLDEALALVKHPSRWLIADKNAISRGTNYNIAVRVRLDTSQLPKPLQFNAINDNEWRLSSEWKHMTFKADEK